MFSLFPIPIKKGIWCLSLCPFYRVLSIAPVLWLLEHYYYSRLKCILAHVTDLQGVSVIWVPSPIQSNSCQGHLAWAAVDGSQSARPDGPLCTHYVLLLPLWRWDITSKIQKTSTLAVSDRSGILYQVWHENERGRNIWHNNPLCLLQVGVLYFVGVLLLTMYISGP